MLDLQFIRNNPDLIQRVCKHKNANVDIKKFLALDDKRRHTQSQIDELRQQRNQLSGSTKPSSANIARIKKLKNKTEELEADLIILDDEFQQLWRRIPNLYSKDTPVGKDESHNKVIRKWGEPTKFSFKPKTHLELGTELDLIDTAKAGEVAGSRFSYLKNSAVKLQFALISWVIATLSDSAKLSHIIKTNKLDVADTPFIPMVVPALVKAGVFAKTGRLEPIEDKYWLETDELFLSGSAEHTLSPYHMNEVIDEQRLPLRYLGYSTAFRREAGSYGKDVRGILRQHQFDKLEMESFSTVEQGEGEQQLLVGIQEYLMQELKLPYRVVAISTGDMGKPDYRQIDIETWLPSESNYRETQTSDYVTDYQARGLNIKYQPKTGAKLFVHMNDATALAIGRTLIAIFENYQTAAGKIKIPKVLQSYMGKVEYL